MVTFWSLVVAVTGPVLGAIAVSALRQLGLIDLAAKGFVQLGSRLKDLHNDGLIDLRIPSTADHYESITGRVQNEVEILDLSEGSTVASVRGDAGDELTTELLSSADLEPNGARKPIGAVTLSG